MPNELANATVAPVGLLAPKPESATFTLPSPLADVQQGAVPAITLAPLEGKKGSDLQEFVVDHFDELGSAGLDYHELPDMKSVLFNPEKITSEQIDAAAQAGKLFDIAPLASELGKPVTAAPPAAPQAAPQAAAGPLAGATAAVPSSDKKLETARLKNLAPAPKSAPNPVPALLQRRAM